MRAALRIVVAAILTGSLALTASPTVAQTTRMLTVRPDANLVEGDVVTLEGSGFAPRETVYFCQAVNDGTPGADDCGLPFASALPNADGEFSATYVVQRFMTPPSVGAEIDCAQPSADCVIGATHLSLANVVFAPLAFVPLPPRTTTVMPAADLLDGAVVSVRGSGFTPSTTAYFCQGEDEGAPGIEDCRGPFQSAVADASGEFFANYTVQRFMRIAAAPGTTRDCAAPSANCVMNFLASDGLGIGRVPLGFAPQVPVASRIFGTVTDADGNPVAGAAVWAFTPADTWVASLQTTTNDQGAYAFPAIEVGTGYNILFRAPGGTLASEWYDDYASRALAEFVILPSDADFIAANAELVEAGSISGTVTDANGPVAGVKVFAYRFSDTWVSSYVTTTSIDGTYVFANATPVSYQIRYAPPQGSGLNVEWFDNAPKRGQGDFVTVFVGEATTGIDAVLGPVP